MKHNKPHVIACVIVALYGVALFLAYLPVFLPPYEALDGIGVALLTMPWIGPVIDLLDAIDPELIGHPVWGTLATLVCAAINACLLYFVTYWAVRLITRTTTTEHIGAP
jgi:hypothetical protein